MRDGLPSGLAAKLGIVATVLLVPGGSLIGAAVALRWWRQRRAARVIEQTLADQAVTEVNSVTSKLGVAEPGRPCLSRAQLRYARAS